MELLLRFLIGGAVVSAFAAIADLLKPRSFAGLFGAAPSVALATLGMAVLKDGRGYAAIECRSMILGAAALGAYTFTVCQLSMRKGTPALSTALYTIALWLGAALGLRFLLLK